MFDADRPILTRSQDRLGRVTFAQYLARCILDHKSTESFVIGLYGGLGVGKTSVINLMLEELRFASSNMFDDEKPIILNFSAWSYSGQNQLIYSFFRRLSSEMRAFPYLANADKIIHLLELYVSFFTHQPVPKSLRPKRYFKIHWFKTKSMTEETSGWESGRDLTQVKAELNELLSQQKHKIIIIIDNIVSLEKDEIRQIFQIVKSMGDYANTVYLLSLNKEHILHIANKIQAGFGAAYLEKIIQLPYEIPPISSQDLEVILTDKLNQLLDIVPEESWNREYWADLYYSSLKYFFENVRDVTRYVNTLSFNYIHVKEVVNPVDFFAITALLVFSPNIYNGIRDNKDLFTDLMDHVYRLDAKKIAEDKARCDEILNRERKISREKILHLLLYLFPRLRNLYETKINFYHSEIIAANNKRICSPDDFDVYFRLSMPRGLIPESEMKALLTLTSDQEGFGLALLRLNKDDRIIKFLDHLDGGDLEEISNENAGNVIDALMDSADLFPEGEDSLVSFPTPLRVHRILHQLLRRFDSTEQRYALYREAITKAINSLYIIVYELSIQSEEHIEDADTYLPLEHRDFTLEQLQALQKLALGKIMYWAEIGRLIEHPKLLPILYAWKEWGDEFACREFVGRAVQEDKGLLAFLYAALQKPIDVAIIKNEKTSDAKESLANVEAFISAKVIEAHAKQMFEADDFEKLREREQLAILIFLDLIKADAIKIIPNTTV